MLILLIVKIFFNLSFFFIINQFLVVLFLNDFRFGLFNVPHPPDFKLLSLSFVKISDLLFFFNFFQILGSYFPDLVFDLVVGILVFELILRVETLLAFLGTAHPQ